MFSGVEKTVSPHFRPYFWVNSFSIFAVISIIGFPISKTDDIAGIVWEATGMIFELKLEKKGFDII